MSDIKKIPVHDITHTGSRGKFKEFTPDDYEPKEVRIEADRLVIRVGTLEVDLDGTGHGTVKIDGILLKCRALKLLADVESIPVVTLEVFPMKAYAH